MVTPSPGGDEDTRIEARLSVQGGRTARCRAGQIAVSGGVGSGDDGPVASGFLGGVEGGIGDADELGGVLRCLVGESCAADADGDGDLLACLGDGGFADCSSDAFGHLCQVDGPGAGQDDEEFLPAVAHQHVAFAQDLSGGADDALEDPVADEVAVGVVGRLEVVQVEHEQPEGVAGAQGTGRTPRRVFAGRNGGCRRR